MSGSGPISDVGGAALRAVLANPRQTMIGLDFDGTLAPIIADPDQAYADEDAVGALAALGPLVGCIVVITGRPAETAVRLGGFAGRPGLESMVVMGQYGVERWDAATGEFTKPPEPEGITRVTDELPELLASLGLGEARIEHKGRAIGIHTRELDDPTGAFDRLVQPLTELAERNGLQVEPGKNVLEIRPHGYDKGDAVRAIVAEKGPRQVIFAGDDLGDLPAFRAVQALRADGIEGLLVCSASHEEDALAEISDLVLDGPAGVAEWLGGLARELDSEPRSDSERGS